MISGKNRLTPLIGTMTLRGSVVPDVAGDEKLSHASKRVPIVAIDNAVSRLLVIHCPCHLNLPALSAHFASMHQRIAALAAARAFNRHPAVRSFISSACA